MSTDQYKKRGHICWGELCTTDIAASKKFYNKLFGREYAWEDESSISSTDDDYALGFKDKKPVVGMMNLSDTPNAHLPPHWGVYMTVECIDSALELTKESGGSILMGKTPMDNGGAMAIIKDPQGATLGLMQLTK